MYKYFLCLLLFFFIGCNASENFIKPIKPELNTISFDVVEKQLNLNGDIPENLKLLLSKWFDEKIKVSGYQGDVLIEVYDYKEEIISVDEGKRIDNFLFFKIILNKSSLKKEYIEGSVTSYGTISGDFSLQEFDTLIQNTHIHLVQRLSKKLSSLN